MKHVLAVVGAGIVAALILLAVFFAAISLAAAHDWYPMECCHQMDCAPVDETSASTFVTGGAMSFVPMTVKTKYGTAIVPDNFPRRQSQDGRMHACIVNGKLICLFVPPSS